MSSSPGLNPELNPDHCKVPNRSTYNNLSWLMVGQFVLGLPLNLSVLYIFIFRYVQTQSHKLVFYYCIMHVSEKINV